MQFKVENFSCTTYCSSLQIKEYYMACSEFSYEFTKGIYVLQGEIDSGAWAFTNALDNKIAHTRIDEASRFYLNNKEVGISEIRDITCCIDGIEKPKVKRMNVVEALDKLIRETKSNRTVEEIINLFDIPYDEVIDPYRHTFPRYRAIKGLLEGKKIFTTTWKSHHEYRFQDVLYTKIQKALKKEDVIFIIPSSEKNIFIEGSNKINMQALIYRKIQEHMFKELDSYDISIE